MPIPVCEIVLTCQVIWVARRQESEPRAESARASYPWRSAVLSGKPALSRKGDPRAIAHKNH